MTGVPKGTPVSSCSYANDLVAFSRTFAIITCNVTPFLKRQFV